MKKLIFSFLFLILAMSAGTSRAQDIYYSKEQKFTFQNGDFSVVGWCGDRLYTYRASKEGFYLDAFNDSMRLMATVALDFFPKKIYETKFYTTDDQIIVLYQAVQNNKVVQYAARLDNKARMLQKPVALDSTKMSWFSGDKKYYTSVMSGDKKKIMVFGMGNRKDKKLVFNTVLLDAESLNIQAKGEPYIDGENDFSLGQSLLANDGTLFMSAFTENGSRNFSGDAWLFRLSADGAQFNNIVLPLGENYISGMFIKLNYANNDVYIGATYSTKKSGNLEGVTYGLYSAANNSFSSFKMIPFDDQIRNGTDDRNKKKAFNDYVVRNLIVKNDGGFILVLEDFYMSTRTTSYGNGLGYYSWYNNNYATTSTREYHYGDVLTIDYDIDGNRKWHSFIRKEQYSQEDDGLFSSYALLNSGGSLVFLYNDFNTSKSSLNLAAIDVDGNLQMKKMNPGRNEGADWLPRSGKQTDIKELLIPVLRKNSLGFARVVF
jgi:hypothetical protein